LARETAFSPGERRQKTGYYRKEKAITEPPGKRAEVLKVSVLFTGPFVPLSLTKYTRAFIPD
jgi:hypothetical protein